MADEGINFTLKVKDDGTATIKKFDGSLDHLDNTVKKTNKGFLTLGKTTKRLVSLIGVGSAIGLGAAVIKTGAQFQLSMATVGGVMRATESEMKELTATARKMGSETEKTATQAANALKFLGMAGFNASQAIAALPGVIDLSTAAGVELSRSADIASNALTAMGLDVSELSRVNDTFVATMTRSNVNMEQIAEAFKFAAPKAKAYGMDIETLTALIGKLGDAGIQGSMAGTQLAFAMGQSGKLFKKYGINGEGRDFVDALELIAEKQLGVTELTKIFGDRGGRAVLVLKDLVPEFKKLREEVGKDEGAAKRLAEAMRNTLSGSFDSLKSAVEGVGLDIFSKSSGDLKEAIDLLTEGVRNSSEEIAILGDVFGNMLKSGLWAIDQLSDEFTVLSAAMMGDIDLWDALTMSMDDYKKTADKLKEDPLSVSLESQAESLKEKIADLEKVTEDLSNPWLKLFGPDSTTNLNKANKALEDKKMQLDFINDALKEQNKTLSDRANIMGGDVDDPLEDKGEEKKSVIKLFSDEDLENAKAFWEFAEDFDKKSTDLTSLVALADQINARKEMLIEAGIEEQVIDDEIFAIRMETNAQRDKLEFEAAKTLATKIADEELSIAEKKQKAIKKLDTIELANKKALFGNVLSLALGSSKAAFAIQKAAQIAQTIASGHAAALLALATIPPPFGEIVAKKNLLFGYANAAAIGALAISGRERGGNVSAGTPYVVGEAGQEIFTPNVSGVITPNNKLGGNETIVVNNNFYISTLDASGMRETVREEIFPLIIEGIENNVNELRDAVRKA